MDQELFQLSEDSNETNQESKAFMTDVNFYQPNHSKNNPIGTPNPKSPIIPRKSKNIVKVRNLLPRISKSMRQQRHPSQNKLKKKKERQSINRELKHFVRDFNQEIKKSKSKKPLQQNRDWNKKRNPVVHKKPKSTLKCVETFLARQEEKTRQGLKGVYNRQKRGNQNQNHVIDALRKIENQDTFKQLLTLKEEELIRTKKEFNKGNFKLQKLRKQAQQLEMRSDRARQEMGASEDQSFIKRAVAERKTVEEGLEEVKWATESLKFRHKSCIHDLLVMKKNTETLKNELRKWRKVEADLKRKRNNHIKQANFLKREIDCERKRRGEANGLFRGSQKLKNIFHEELEKFHGKVILDEILKNKQEIGNHNNNFFILIFYFENRKFNKYFKNR